MTIDLRLIFHRAGFDLDVALKSDSRVLAVFGPSGCGKTTLLSLLAGLLQPEQGRIALDGQTLYDSRQGVNVPIHLRRLGVVFQDGRLFPHRSVSGNLRFGERLTPSAERRFSFEEVIALLELEETLGRSVAELSGGQQRRVALGRALLMSPRALLLDEPLAGLDDRLRQQIIPYLQRICRTTSIPVICVTHDLSEALQLTDTLALMEAGRITACGTYRDLLMKGAVHSSRQRTGAVNILRMTVAKRDPMGRTAELALSAQGPRLRCPRVEEADGAAVSVRIRPEDVAVSLSRVEEISVQNQVPGRVTRLVEHDGWFLVEVDVGFPLLAEVGAGSVERLVLEPGREVWCLVKASAVEVLGPAG